MFQAKKGFTMIELLVVLLIIGILAAVAAPMYLAHVAKAKVAEAVGVLALARQAEREYYTKHSSWLAVTAGNIENDPEDATDPGLGVIIGPSQYFGVNSYAIAVPGTINGDTPKDFTITATGAAEDTAGDVRNEADVVDYVVQMDNSGLIRYTADGTNWKTY